MNYSLCAQRSVEPHNYFLTKVFVCDLFVSLCYVTKGVNTSTKSVILLPPGQPAVFFYPSNCAGRPTRFHLFHQEAANSGVNMLLLQNMKCVKLLHQSPE